MIDNVYFTADEHYGHRNIITYCNRPFSDTDEMREALIFNHNLKVTPSGLTYHIGDMFWDTVSDEEAISILNRLNGRHVILRGNHGESVDERAVKWGLENAKVSRYYEDVLLLRQERGPKLWLSHYAHRVWPGSHKGSYHLFGHSHGELPDEGLSHDVGVDPNKFTPLSLREVNSIMGKRVAAGVKHVLADRIAASPWPLGD